MTFQQRLDNMFIKLAASQASLSIVHVGRKVHFQDSIPSLIIQLRKSVGTTECTTLKHGDAQDSVNVRHTEVCTRGKGQ